MGAAVWLWAGRGLPGEGVEVPDYVQADLLTVNPWSRPGTPLEKIDGIVIHYVGNPGTTAKANRNYFESLSSGETEKDFAILIFPLPVLFRFRAAGSRPGPDTDASSKSSRSLVFTRERGIPICT